MSARLFNRLTISVVLAVVAFLALLLAASSSQSAEARMTVTPRPTLALAPQSPGLALPQVITTVVFPPGIGAGPSAVGVNPATGYVYVANRASDEVTVLSGTQVITTLAVGSSPGAVGVNPNTGYIHVANFFSRTVTALSGTQVLATLATGSGPDAVGVNPATGYVFMANNSSNTVTVLSSTRVLETLAVGAEPTAIGVNPVNGLGYVTNYAGHSISIIGIPFRVFLPLVQKPRCETHTASMTLSTTATTLRIGDVVTLTATLFNQGCAGLGVPLYRLYIQSSAHEPIFDPASPEPIVHYWGIGPGQSDTADFALRAVNSGQATLSASASFEVHLGYPGPAYWSSSSTGPLVITVSP